MNTRNLKLNDFETFDKLIFRGNKPNWEKFYDPKYSAFYPPIPNPKTEVEFQLDHYALWMTIAHYGLTSKPQIFRRRGFRFRDALHARGRCYACSWHYHIYNSASCTNPLYPCPLTSSDGDKSCGPEWHKWCHLCQVHPESIVHIQQAAYNIAHIEWREIS